MRILSVVGNRPQFIKSGPLSVALRDAGIDEVVVHTGQHYDPELSQVFFDELDLAEPAHRLDVRSRRLTKLVPRIRPVIRDEHPDLVLVYGDTNSTLAGARAAAELGVPIAHVEAGLRSGDLSMPEERARIEVDRASSVLFCPDQRSRQTLVAEGVEGRIEVVGDVMADVCFRLGPVARQSSEVLARFVLEPGRYVVATIHREANVRPRTLARIVDGLGRVADRVIFPAHPLTRARIDGSLVVGSNVRLIEALGYLDFAALASQARVIVTDSGGLQKEAYWYGVPCVTARSTTEWVDTVEAGANVLVGDDPDRLASAVAAARMPDRRPQLYGDGRASERIATALLSTLPAR